MAFSGKKLNWENAPPGFALHILENLENPWTAYSRIFLIPMSRNSFSIPWTNGTVFSKFPLTLQS